MSTQSKENNLVYIVDDDEQIVELFGNLSEIFGYETKRFTSPFDAINQIENGDRPTILITDYNMPGMNGLELSEIISQKSPSTYRFLHTGNNGIEAYLNNSKKEGILNKYSFKPTSMNSVKEILKSYSK